MKTKDIAESFRQGLALGLVHVDEVIAWADSEILNSDSPKFEIIEIAASFDSTPDRLIGLLNNVPGEFDLLVVIKNVFSLITRKLKTKPKKAFKLAQMLYSLCIEFETELPNSFADKIYHIDDCFELAVVGEWGSIEKATQLLIVFLEQNGSGLDWLKHSYK